MWRNGRSPPRTVISPKTNGLEIAHATGRAEAAIEVARLQERATFFDQNAQQHRERVSTLEVALRQTEERVLGAETQCVQLRERLTSMDGLQKALELAESNAANASAALATQRELVSGLKAQLEGTTTATQQLHQRTIELSELEQTLRGGLQLSQSKALFVINAFGQQEKPPGPREAALEALAKVNGDRFKADFHADGTLKFLAGTNVAPTCTVSAKPTRVEATRYLQCVLESTGLFFAKEGQDPRDTDIRIADVASDREGVLSIRAQQFYGTVPVRRGEIKLEIAGGKLLQLNGHLYTRSDIPPADKRSTTSDLKAVQGAAEGQSKRSLTFKRRYFDVPRSSIVSEFVDPQEPHIHVFIDERTLKVFAIENLANRQTLLRKSTQKLDYTGGFDRSTSPTPGTVHMKYARLPLRDTCSVYLDRGSDEQHGEPKVGLKWSGEFVPNGSEIYWQISNCQIDAPFMSYADTTSRYFKTMNAYFWLHDLYEFAKHADTAYDSWYDWDNYESENLRVEVKKRDPVPHASSGAREYKIVLPIDATDPSQADDSPLDLSTIAHEYGHVIHFMYGSDIDYDYDDRSGNFSGQAVEEGFAQSNVLRYALFRRRKNRPHDPYVTLQYDGHPTGFTDYSHDDAPTNGEYHPTGSATAGALIYRDRSAECIDDPHECGDVLPIVYWELAWNECQVSYRDCTIGERVLATANAEQLVNVAYTYAMKSMHEDDGIEDFFNSVSTKYLHYLNVGWITTADYDRVHAVLNHHCVGWGNHCDSYYRLPGSLLPAVFTRDASFANGDDEHLVMPQQMTHQGSPLVRPHASPDGLTYLRLDDPSDQLVVQMNFPIASYYEFHAVVRSSGYCEDALFIQVDSVAPRRWHIGTETCNAWAWNDSRARIWVTAGPGPHTVRIGYNSQPTDVAALLIRRRACASPRTCASAGAVCRRISDNCGGILDCPCAVETIATLGNDTGAIALDTSHVYVTLRRTGADRLLRLPKTGGPQQVLTDAVDNAFRIAVDDQNVYWTNDRSGTLMKMSKTGGVATRLARSPRPCCATDLSLDRDQLFWLASPNVMRIGTDGSNPVALAANQSLPSGVSVHGTDLFWTEQSLGRVRRATRDGANATIFASNQHSPADVVAEPAAVFWLNHGSIDATNGAVMRSPNLQLASHQHWPRSLAVNDTNAFWINSATTASGYQNGSIAMLSKSARWPVTPMVIAAAQGRPFALAADRDYIYWTTGRDVRRVRLYKASQVILTVATTGEDPDVDGYTATLNGESRAIRANDTINFGNLSAGDYTLALAGLENNCALAACRT